MQESVIRQLCRDYVTDVRGWHSLSTYDCCHLLLCASDLAIAAPILIHCLKLLEEAEIPYIEPGGDFFHAILRLLVFTRWDIQVSERKMFLDYWLDRRNLQRLDIVGSALLLSFAVENLSLLEEEQKPYVLSWHLRHDAFTNPRVNAWSVYGLMKSGNTELARRRCVQLLAARLRNGSWDHDVRKTVACAYPLALSQTVTAEDLDDTVEFVLGKLDRRFDYGPALRANTIRLLAVLGVLPDVNRESIRTALEYTGSIFLSHTTSDKKFVRRLAADLERRGVHTWVDEAEILVGESLVDAIESGIAAMQYLGVVLSTASLRSPWVNKELNMALVDGLAVRQVKVIPIRIERCEIPLRLRDIKYADFSEDYEKGLRELIRRLRPDFQESGEQNRSGTVRT